MERRVLEVALAVTPRVSVFARVYLPMPKSTIGPIPMVLFSRKSSPPLKCPYSGPATVSDVVTPLA